MPDWIIFSLLATTLWGIWGFLGKFAATGLTPKQLLAYSVIGYAAMTPVFLWWAGRDLLQVGSLRSAGLALLTGVVSAAAGGSYYFAITKGEVSLIVVITSMYPVITCLLSFALLGEPLGANKLIGMALCLAGVVFLVR